MSRDVAVQPSYLMQDPVALLLPVLVKAPVLAAITTPR